MVNLETRCFSSHYIQSNMKMDMSENVHIFRLAK